MRRCQACADKLDRELSKFGIPPQFPAPVEEEAAAEQPADVSAVGLAGDGLAMG